MYSIGKIKEILGVKSPLVAEDSVIEELLTDSRKLLNPATTLFFAIAGARLDGHNYLKDLYNKGVRNFVVENSNQEIGADANVILVKSAVVALQTVAKNHRQQFQYPVIGITGSNGKTIIKEWLHQLLQEDFNIVRSPKSFNSQIGVPISVWKMSAENNLAIFEAGISEPDEMQNLQKIIQPTIGVFTNIGSAHGQNFISETHKVKEKLKLFLRSKVLIYSKDHTAVNQSISDYWQHTINDETEKPIFFSWSEKVSADLRIKTKEILFNKTELNCIYKEKEITFELPFTDKSSVENGIHCIAVMLYLGYDEAKINENLKRLKRIEMRLEQKNGVNNCILINDSYNSDLESLKIALDFLAQQEQTQKRTLILSDILQSGIPSLQLYKSVSELLSAANVSVFIGIGKEIIKNKALFENNNSISKTRFYASTEEFLANETHDSFENESILLKGARSFQFERINTFLEEKAHATIFEVNLNSVLHNLKFFSSKLNSGTKIMVMVKAFAYGSGLYEIAKLLEFHRVDYLGVAYADEGIALRKMGIKIPIMVLNSERRSFDALIRFNLEPEIYSFELLKDFTEALVLAGDIKNYPVHINIDTGMRRLGFEPEDIELLGKTLKANTNLKVATIYTHLAASEAQEYDEFTKGQISSFEKLSSELLKYLDYKVIRHVLNSSGIIRFPESQMDMVRLGLGLYGVNELCQSELEPIGRLKSKISQIRDLKKGETVGYGRVGKMTKDGRIGVIAIGYADGLKRSLSNGKGSVFLHNKRIPIIGNVCMDMTMIDLSDMPEAEENDEVEIFGKNIPVSEVAEQAGTISYEILTSISERVKRVFFME